MLNERPGVRAATVQRVLDAVISLGFVRDVSAANLARQRRYHFFLLPEREDQFIDALSESISDVTNSAIIDRTRMRAMTAAARDPHDLARLRPDHGRAFS